MGSIYFAINYKVPDGAFRRAAQTWELEVVDHCAPDLLFLKEEVHTEDDFRGAWGKVHARARSTGYPVAQGQIFSHASKGGAADGLEFARGDSGDSTLDQTDIRGLPALNWAEDGTLILSGCNTGLVGRRGWCPARTFATSQGVRTVGLPGYGYFSRCHRWYSQIDNNATTIYLWAYRRARNGLLGGGERMPGIAYLPSGRVGP